MKHIYIAGPLYGSGNLDANVKKALQVAEEVNKYDGGRLFVPFVPHLYFFWNFWHAYPREYWLRMDKEWLKKCDAVIAIEGESPGTRLEEAWAEEFGIHVHPLKEGWGQLPFILRRIEQDLPPDPSESSVPQLTQEAFEG